MPEKKSLILVHKLLKKFPIELPKSENQSPILENQLDKFVPKLLKNSPIEFTKLEKPSVRLFQKPLKKLPIDVTISWSLVGILDKAFQILSNQLESG